MSEQEFRMLVPTRRRSTRRNRPTASPARADVPDSVAETYVQEVTGTLERVVPDEEFDRAAAQLPDEFGDSISFID